MFDNYPTPTIIVNTASAIDPHVAERRGDFLTAVYVGLVTATILLPGMNQLAQNSLGLLVRGGFPTTATAPTAATTGDNSQTASNSSSTTSDSEVGAKVIAMMKAKNYQVVSDMNIVYLRGFYCRKFDGWCDRQLVIDGTGKVLFDGKSTTLPGATYYDKPANPDGTFAITPGQYSAWQVGQHCGLSGSRCHEALVQASAVDGTRAFKRDRSDAKPVNGSFGINLHGSSSPRETVGPYSAGCLVSATMSDHERFMGVVKKFNKGTYTATILDWK